MKLTTLIGCAAVVLLVACVVSPPPHGESPSAEEPLSGSGYELAAFEGAIIEATNHERASAGLTRLTIDSRLAQAASVQATNMARLGRASHTLPETATPTLVSRVNAAGYPYTAVAENIAYGRLSVGAVVRGWMESPVHRANILGNYTDTSVGVARGADGSLYFCQVFGRLRTR